MAVGLLESRGIVDLTPEVVMREVVMRCAVAVLVVVVGCGDPDVGSSIEINPGPVAPVPEGNLLQLAARVPGASHTFALVIDDEARALFEVLDLAATDGGAILTLVPACNVLDGETTGSVAMSLRTEDPDIAPVTLSIQILAEPDGICTGSPEHAITHATLQVADLPDSGRILCTRTTARHGSDRDDEREVLRASASVPSYVVVRNGGILCGTETVTLDLWPPIDAQPVESLAVETFSCDVAGCEESPGTCCEADPERRLALTDTNLVVPVRSRSEYIDAIDGTSIACADLDHNGTPELVLAARLDTVTSEVGDAGRFSESVAQIHATGLLAFQWQAGPAAVEPVLLGGFGTQVKRAQLTAGSITWVDDPQFTFVTSTTAGDPAQPSAVLPVPTAAHGAASYVARFANGIDLTCISPTCTAGTTHIDTFAGAQLTPFALGSADVDGDGSEDLVVAYKPGTLNLNGPNDITFRAFLMTWDVTPSAIGVDLATVSLSSVDLEIVGVRSGVACDRIYVLVGQSEIYELDPGATACGPASYVSHRVPTPNEIYSLATVDERVLIATALGIFELSHPPSTTGVAIRQVDPLLQEVLATTGNALVDPAFSNYGQTFTPCYASTPSAAFQFKRGDYVWAEIDAKVEGFGDP